MPYVPPANRSNQHIKHWQHELYLMPKSDKTGVLTRLTVKANTMILVNVTFKYRIGLRVSGQSPVSGSRFHSILVSGVIIDAQHNIGLNEYRIQADDGKRYWLAENNIQVISLAEVA